MIPDALKDLTYSSYELASLRSNAPDVQLTSSNEGKTASDAFNAYSSENILPLIPPTFSLIGMLLSHYAIIPIMIYLVISSSLFNGPLVGAVSLILPTIALVCSAHIAVTTFHYPKSCISGATGENSLGSSTKPGLYHAPEGKIADIVKNCPILTAKTTIQGSLPKLPSTPWVFSGDMRTILPYLAFAPNTIMYQRRWVRIVIPLFQRTFLNYLRCYHILNSLGTICIAVLFTCTCKVGVLFISYLSFYAVKL